MECSSAHLRYLLVIDRLSEEGGAVSSVEVARALGVKKPSVTRMLETLQEKGLAEKERYGKIALTPAGAETARRYRRQLERLAAGFPGMGLRLTEPEALPPPVLSWPPFRPDIGRNRTPQQKRPPGEGGLFCYAAGDHSAKQARIGSMYFLSEMS